LKQNPTSNKEGLSVEQSGWRVPLWFPDLDPQVENGLRIFSEELIKSSKTSTLVPLKTLSSMDISHFAECIIATKLITALSKHREVFDFGSGAGFPGIVFALMNPPVTVHLVESDIKKADFLKGMIKTLSLKNADVVIRAVESLPEASVECAISRNFSNLSKSILSTRKVFKKGASFFHLKGEEWASEIASIPTQLCSIWLPSLVGDYKLPIGEIKFAVIKTEKIGI
jgi:16S rRNA (guanine527-N7)-methyltransferase